MAEQTNRAALPHANVPSGDTEDTPGRPLLFIQVQPQTSGSTPKPLRTIARKHVLRNRLRESPEGVRSCSTGGAPGDMRKQLSRFRLDGENQSGYTQRTLRPLTTRPNFHLGPPQVTTSDPWLSNQLCFPGDMPIQDSVTTYRRDPFTEFPIDADNKVQELFSFYKKHLNDLNNKSLSANPKRDFIPIVPGNAACFRILMATLLQYQRFQGARGGACFWYHRGATITALNQELSSQDAQITDTMFFTVVMLLYVESRVPHSRSSTASLHMAALIKFLELRKGALRDELYCMLLRVATWCSINPPLTRPPLMVPMQDLDFDFERKLPCHEKEFTPLPQDIFDNLKIFVRLRAELDEDDERRSCVLQDFVSRCLKLASTSLSTLLLASMSNAVQCIQLGQILFLCTICPSMSVSGVYSQSIAVALRGCLETGWGESGDPVVWSPEVLCWLLVNGAITQQVKSLQVWYLRRLVEFTRYQKLQTFDQLESLMRKTAWADEQFGPACKSIWKEVMATQASEDK